jgi:hypothetical protein
LGPEEIDCGAYFLSKAAPERRSFGSRAQIRWKDLSATRWLFQPKDGCALLVVSMQRSVKIHSLKSLKAKCSMRARVLTATSHRPEMDNFQLNLMKLIADLELLHLIRSNWQRCVVFR